MRYFLLAFPLLTLGCVEPEKKDAGRVSVFPVEGRLLVAGEPAAKAQVVFHPLGESVFRPVAFTDADGRFRLMTYTAGDGAPAGEYAVTIFWENEADPLDGCVCPDPAAHDRLGGLYFEAKTTALRATVNPERNEIVLRAEVGGRSWNLPRPNKGKDKTGHPTPPRGERDWDRGDRPER